MTKINVRLRAVKVRFAKSNFRILRALHNFSEGKKRRKKVTRGSRFYAITSLWVVFSLTTLYFKAVAWLVTYHANKTMERTVVFGSWAGVCGEERNTSSPACMRGRLTYRRLGRAFPEASLRGTLLKEVLTIAELIAPRHHKGNSKWLCIQ